jgi:hypothetical protein
MAATTWRMTASVVACATVPLAHATNEFSICCCNLQHATTTAAAADHCQNLITAPKYFYADFAVNYMTCRIWLSLVNSEPDKNTLSR